MENAVSSQALPLPPGTSVNLLDPQIFLEAIERLGIQPSAVVTPWATRTSDVSWEPILQPPSANVILYGINDATLGVIHQATFGHLMPFVAIHSNSAGNIAGVQQAFNGTRYSFYETQAVYAQARNAPSVPTATFVHWAKVRDPADKNMGTGSLDQAAQALGGSLCLGFQVDYQTTALRTPPGVTFEQASTPIPSPSAPEIPPAEPPPQKASSPSSSLASWLGPLALGAVAAAGTYYLVTRTRK